MEKKELQEQRVRSYFIDATKQMIKGEGIKSVSARAVSEYAGYSYATLYNYFKDLKELIFICVVDFVQEIREYVASNVKIEVTGIDSLTKRTVAYTNYFVQYIGIYDLLFLEKMPEFAFTQGLSDEICNLIIEITKDDWIHLKWENNWTNEQLIEVQNRYKYYIAGMLLYYLNRRIPTGYTEFISNMKKNIVYLVNE